MTDTHAITEEFVFTVLVLDGARGMEAAWSQASNRALAHWGITEDGYSDRDDIDFVRSTDEIMLALGTIKLSMSMGGHQFTYTFRTWIERCEDE